MGKGAVLRKWRHKGGGDPASVAYWVNSKVISNVREAKVFPAGRFNKNDRQSSEDALKLLRSTYDSPGLKKDLCLYYAFPNDNIEDAVVIFATPRQIQLLREHGRNGVIGVDTTFQKTQAKHFLTTVVVQDERRHGVPVAFCISPRHDIDTFKIFFKQLRDVAGTITCQHFISDGEETFYNAWSIVMGQPLNRRLCIWHVKKNWGKKLTALRFHGQEYEAAKKTLSDILEEPSIPK